MLTKNEKFIFFITSYTPMWIIFLLKIYFTEKTQIQKYFSMNLLAFVILI